MQFIDDDAQYHQVLFQLGLLDDDDNWPLFCELQRQEPDIDVETYLKYTQGRG